MAQPTSRKTEVKVKTKACHGDFRRIVNSTSDLASTLTDRDAHLCAVQRIIPPVALQVDDLVGYLHSGDHFPEDRILPIEEVSVRNADKKLRAGAIRIIRPSH